MATKAIVLAEYRRKEAMKLRLAGWSYTAIGDKLHISHSTASRAVSRTLKQLSAVGIAFLQVGEDVKA